MKTFCISDAGQRNPVYLVLQQIINALTDAPEETLIDPVDHFEEAELVFVIGGRRFLVPYYTPDKVFILFLFYEEEIKYHREDESVPNNVLLGGLDLRDNINAIKMAYDQVKDLRIRLAKRDAEENSAISLPSDLAVTRGSYRVLVIDDTRANLLLAERLLGRGGHQVTLANSFSHGMGLLGDGSGFDVVLTDMHMPDSKHYPAFNMERAKIGGTNPYGFFAIFEATSRGLPVAVVTDANHHNDWVSAGLDRLMSATVNKRVVLMFNNIGKRWDKALLALEEVGAFEPSVVSAQT